MSSVVKYKILLEASGSLASAYLVKAVKAAGAIAVASDIEECGAGKLAHEFVLVPRSNDTDLWKKMEEILTKNGINVIIPSFDEMLLGWAERKEYFLKKGIHVILSPSESIETCLDKWKTFEFFKSNGIPTAETSLENDYPLLKPRAGRGGKDIYINSPKASISMEGMISQELLTGQEYTIDVFCDNVSKPVYIIPRKRLLVKEGKSVNAITVEHQGIVSTVEKICTALPFIGPVNMQCFVSEHGDIRFTEINPRVGGGTALGFAASENWVKLILEHTIRKRDILPVKVKYNLKMFRYYDETFSF